MRLQNEEVTDSVLSFTWKDLWKTKSTSEKVAFFVGVALSVFQIYTALFGSLDALMQRSIHLGLGLILVFLIFPVTKGGRDKEFRALDAMAVIAVVVMIGYLLYNYEWITVERYTLISDLYWYEKVLGVIAILLVLEAARRVVSPGLLWVSVGFLVYPFLALYLPGVLRAAPTEWTAILDFNYLSLGGIFGIPIGVSATEIALFIIFGAILMRTGGSTLITNVAAKFAARAVGGPAKVAVIASSLFGTISGSGVANVATVGAVTIPMMKRAGYHPNFAAAVEALASTGGQIMPPVMGAAAFVMSAFSGIPYSTIIGYAIFPAVLFYVSLFFTVDLEARRLGLPIVKSEVSFRKTLRDYGHMILPIAVLIYFLLAGYTPRLAGGLGIVVALAASHVKKTTRLTVFEMLNALYDGAKGMLIVVISCAAAGIIVGSVDMTGLGHRLGSAFVYLSGGSLTLGLILAMLVAILLGLGLSTTPAYIVQVATVIPALITLGLPPFAAHLFAFYYSCLAIITPPDASAAYTAAAIAEADGWKTGWLSSRLGLVAYIVPFMFAYNQALLLVGPVGEVVFAVISACLGVWCLAAAGEGYFISKLEAFDRLLAGIAAILLIAPFKIPSLCGAVIMAYLVVSQYLAKKRNGQGYRGNTIQRQINTQAEKAKEENS